MDASARLARSRFDRDVAWSAFAMLVPIAAGLLALPVIFRNVGQHVFTLFLLSYGAINFAPSLDLGVARTAQRRIAYARSLHADMRETVVRHALRRALLVSAGAAILVVVGGAILFPTQGSRPAFGLAGVTGLGVGIAIYANTQRGVLEGLDAFSRSALNRAGVGVMLVGAPVLVSFVTRDASALSLAALAIRFPFVWEQQRAIRSVLDRRPTAENAAREDMVSGFMRESGWFALLSMLAVAMSGFDRYIMISWGGLADQPLAIFLATQDLALRAIAVPTALLPALTVRLAAGDDGAATRLLSRRLFLAIVPAMAIGCIGAALLASVVAGLLYPQLPLSETAMTLRVLLVGIAASAVAQFPMARLVARGHARTAALMHLGEFALYLLLVPVVIARFGATGAAAMWSGRILLDALVLIFWSALRRGERRIALPEAAALGCMLTALVAAIVATA